MLKKQIPVKVFSRALLFTLTLCIAPSCSPGQDLGFVCSQGAGRFATKFPTGVIVAVGPEKDQGFAKRACEASLALNGSEVTVTPGAAQVDIDVLGSDLGMGMPVAAFQIEKSESDIGMTYEVYSLRGTPRLLRTLTKGDIYRAADTDLDGRVEIWTRDAVAVDHFEDIPLSDFEVPPTMVLRFEGQHLVDVGSQFQSYYDQQIARLRAQLDPRLLSEFKNSDGRLTVIPPAESNDLPNLKNTKVKVLEIVWAYLYSGREQDAWRTLTELWPVSDFDRIQKAITGALAGGIRSEIDADFSPAPSPRKKEQVRIYQLTVQAQTNSAKAIMPGKHVHDAFEETSQVPPSQLRDVTMPLAIFLDAPPPTQEVQHSPPVLIDLILDAAGKVSSIQMVNKSDNGPIGDALIKISSHWRFIPAMDSGKAVASHIQMTVSPFR